jgi:hypothetical protein
MRNGGERARRRSGCARCRRSTQAAGRPQPAMPPLAGHSRESTGTPFGFRGLAHNVKLHRRNDGGTFLAFPPVDSELASTSSPVATRFAVLVTGRVVRVLRCVSPLSSSTALARSRLTAGLRSGQNRRTLGRRDSQLRPVPGSRDATGAGGPPGGRRPRPYAGEAAVDHRPGRSFASTSHLVLVGAFQSRIFPCTSLDICTLVR